MESEIESLSIASIKIELKRRGLSSFGLKPDLVQRLKNATQGQLTTSVPAKLPNLFGLTTTSRKRAKDSSASVPDLPAPTTPKRPRTRSCGHLRGQSVWVVVEEHMRDLYELSGGVGKGSLSRTYPTYAVKNLTASVRGRAARQLQALEEQAIVNEDFTKLRSETEHLQLTLCEAFYAAYVSDILDIYIPDRTVASEKACWTLFCEMTKGTFAYRYAAYYKYKTTGWLPRSGLKYGVDWVLYKTETKNHTHASFCIVLNYPLRDEEDNLERSWIGLQNRLRLVKNVSKTLILASIEFNTGQALGRNHPLDASSAVNCVKVTEVTVDRWIP